MQLISKEHVNKAGGPLGRELKILHRDDQTDQRWRDAVNKLIAIDKVLQLSEGFNLCGLAAARVALK